MTDPELLRAYLTDWTGRHQGPAAPVVRPSTTAELSGVLAVCRQFGVAVVPQGGNTGLVGGGVPGARTLEPVVVISTERLRRLDPVDLSAGTVTAGAGITLAGLHGQVSGSGWRYPVDFGARDRATVGGMIATNAGGVRAARFGSTRARLVGVEAVLADGSVVGQLDRPTKDNTGYDLGSLLCGSEGTLGVVTAATLSLVAEPAFVTTALVTTGDLGTAVALGTELRRRVAAVEAVEFVDRVCLDALGASGHAVPPTGAALLVEARADSDPTGALAAVIELWDGVARVAVATDDRSVGRLWSLRDAVPDVIARVGRPLKIDVAVPVGRLVEVVDALPGVVAAADPDGLLFRFGHGGDGNIHVNVVGASRPGAVTSAVVDLVVGAGGTISAEHGLGVDKTALIGLVRSPAEMAAFAAVKAALDPTGIMNPGVIVAQAPNH